MINTSITNYYLRRAIEYERIYQKPERQKNLKQLHEMVAESFNGQNLLEIACGTGYWTQYASRSANSILATDYNEEVLKIARNKDYGNCSVSFIRSDAYSLYGIKGQFSAALIAFWWSHIPKSKIQAFIDLLNSKLTDDATILIIDNRYVKGSNTPINRTDTEGNTYQIRKLSDGTTYEILKNFPTHDEFYKSFENNLVAYNFIELDYFWIARCVLKGQKQRGRYSKKSAN